MESSQMLTTLALAPSCTALKQGIFAAGLDRTRAYAKRTACVKPVGDPIVLADAQTKDDGTRVPNGHDFPRAAHWVGALKSASTDPMIPQVPLSAVQRSP